MHDRFSDRVDFLVVYIKEAHPEDGCTMTDNKLAGIAVNDPTSAGERRQVATTCALQLKIRMPVVVDDMDNSAARRYGGWPDRLYLIGKDGRIVYQSGIGPIGFRPHELEAAIVRELGVEEGARSSAPS